MIEQKLAFAAALSFALAGATYAQFARDHIDRVDSSTAHPFVATVADER